MRDVIFTALFAVFTSPIFWSAALALGYHFLATKNAKAAALVREAVKLVFHAVEDADAQGLLPTGFSKEKLGLEKLEAILDAQGVGMTDDIKTLATIAWQAFNAAHPPDPSPASSPSSPRAGA